MTDDLRRLRHQARTMGQTGYDVIQGVADLAVVPVLKSVDEPL